MMRKLQVREYAQMYMFLSVRTCTCLRTCANYMFVIMRKLHVREYAQITFHERAYARVRVRWRL